MGDKNESLKWDGERKWDASAGLNLGISLYHHGSVVTDEIGVNGLGFIILSQFLGE